MLIVPGFGPIDGSAVCATVRKNGEVYATGLARMPDCGSPTLSAEFEAARDAAFGKLLASLREREADIMAAIATVEEAMSEIGCQQSR